jgi:hypothetical protein
MCKNLVNLEIYDDMRTAFKTLKHLRDETSLAWSMVTKAPDADGHVLFEIYGMFDSGDIECARNAVNTINEMGDYN